MTDKKANLQILLANQKGVHKASAHLRVQGLLYPTEESEVLLPIGCNSFQEYLPTCDPFEEPWKHVV